MASTGYSQLTIQASIVLAAILGAAFILASDRGSVAPNPEALVANDAAETGSFDMLGFLDNAIACQEDEKDVRCWSSVNKIQMFLAGAPVTHEAISARIEGYMELLDSIWKESAASVGDNGQIPKAVLVDVLTHRFPKVTDPASGTIKFEFADSSQPVLVLSEAMEDYDDTIEPWRLLQNWASRHTDRQGRLTIKPVFSEEALTAFYDFLKGFDIAILNRARLIANERKHSVIDAESMTLAFE